MLADLRYAMRALARRPSFAFAAVAMLAIGITANTIVFTLINVLVLRPMPVRDAARVVRLNPVDATGRRHNLVSYPDYLDYRDQSQASRRLLPTFRQTPRPAAGLATPARRRRHAAS